MLLAFISIFSSTGQERAIHLEVTVNGSLSDVWQAWTTKEGILSFFAPDCKIESEVGGAYEIYFDPSAKNGLKGGEGNKILAIQNEKMFSFTWNAPPSLTDVRNQRTHVIIRFHKIDNNQTKVILHHDGWGDGGQWDNAFDYFIAAWGKVVLPRLQYRFEEGAIDWNNPPKLNKKE